MLGLRRFLEKHGRWLHNTVSYPISHQNISDATEATVYRLEYVVTLLRRDFSIRRSGKNVQPRKRLTQCPRCLAIPDLKSTVREGEIFLRRGTY